MATVATSATDVRAQLLREMETKAESINKERTGKGTRVRVGQTRGKNPQVITWEAFDDSKPETLPTSLSEFQEIVKPESEHEVLDYLIAGFNQAQYSAASDPIAEYVEPTWDKETVARFRLVVRNYASGAEVELDEAVSLIKPGFAKAVEKAKAASANQAPSA